MNTETEPVAIRDDQHSEEHKRFFIAFDIALMLASVTLVEWLLVEFPWNYWVIAVPLVILSIVKFVGVVTWFMHLRWDHRLLSVIFVAGLLIATLTCIALLSIMEIQ